MKIPFLDLPMQNKALKHEILEQWNKILLSAGFIGGEYVEGFENDFANACEVDCCISVGSGTDALRFIFLALDLQPGDEVIIPVNTFIATSEAVSQAGGIIRFVDIDPQTYNIDSKRISDALTDRTVGIVAVHLYGQTADMASINEIAEKNNLWVVEDSCQAHLAEYKGKKAGTMSSAAAFSFYPGKNLGACGEAGAVITKNKALAASIRSLRNHGQAEKYFHDIEGYNGRCDALQAAVLQVKLRYLKKWNEKRRKHANQYNRELRLSGLQVPVVRNDVLSVYHLYVVLVKNRDLVATYLSDHGIATGLHYPVPLHLQKAYSHLDYREGDFPVAERCAAKLLSLPMYPELTEGEISYVCHKLSKAVVKYG